MSDGTKIEWADATWNPVIGCQVVSPGCTNCYAMRLAGGRMKHHHSRVGLTQPSRAGPVWNGEVRLVESWLDQPLRWRKPRRIFVCAHGDLFFEGVPDQWIDQVFAVMALAPQHTFIVLTKRAARMRAYLEAATLPYRVAALALLLGRNLPDGHPGWARDRWRPSVIQGCTRPAEWPLPNVWLGVSVEDQRRADERRSPLRDLADAGWLTWVSYEPALGPVDWAGWGFLRWLVSGGESGPGARPSHPDWHRAARDQCDAAGVPFFFKQWGEWVPALPRPTQALPAPLCWVRGDGLSVDGADHVERIERVEGDQNWALMRRAGKKVAGALLDGEARQAWPEGST